MSLIEKIDKKAVLEALRTQIQTEFNLVTKSHQGTTKACTHEESRAESAKDTRATELGYLARGLAKRVLELEHSLLRLNNLSLREFSGDDKLAVGALVEVEDEHSVRVYFISPAGAGLKCQIEGIEILSVTSLSPIGRALVGKRLNDVIEVSLPGAKHEFNVIGVA
jgi:transcription elongation GreA/GreB family factor